jgi:hypothetical protein
MSHRAKRRSRTRPLYEIMGAIRNFKVQDQSVTVGGNFKPTKKCPKCNCPIEIEFVICPLCGQPISN